MKILDTMSSATMKDIMAKDATNTTGVVANQDFLCTIVENIQVPTIFERTRHISNYVPNVVSMSIR